MERHFLKKAMMMAGAIIPFALLTKALPLS